MSFKKMLIGLLTVASVTLVGCKNSQDKEIQNGVDDRSFNQSAWEGLKDWADSHNIPENHINYFQSGNESNYIPHLNSATMDGYDLTYAIRYTLEEALTEVALQNPEQKYGMLDGYIDLPNVVSIDRKSVV